MARFVFGKKKKSNDTSSMTSDKTSSSTTHTSNTTVASPEKRKSDYSNSMTRKTSSDRSTDIGGAEYGSDTPAFGGIANFSLVSPAPVAAPVASLPPTALAHHVHHVPSPIPVSTPPPGSSPWKRFKLFNSPFPRYRHAASAISSEKSEIFLMGGLKEGSVFGDTWKITPEEGARGQTVSYSAKSVDVANLNNPPARVGHSAVLCGNAFIIFGGDTVDTDFNGFPDNNFYLFNINNNKYTIPSHILSKPNGRYGHTVGVISLSNVSSRLYLFGGQLENDVFNDLYYFELNTFKSPKARWELVEPLNNFKPPPLTNHSISVYKHKMYVFGGVYNNERVSNDLWSYDAMVNKWWQIPVTGTIPAPVNEHSSCIVGDKLYIYGGNDFSGVIYNTLYVLDLHTFVWVKLGDDITAGPGPRCGHSMTYLPKYNKIVIMGGDKNDYVVTDPENFETYEEYNGEEIGTMIYELDVALLEHFLPKEKTIEKPIAPPVTKKAASASLSSFAKMEDPYRQGHERHARSSSAGLDDFRTPAASPDRVRGSSVDRFTKEKAAVIPEPKLVAPREPNTFDSLQRSTPTDSDQSYNNGHASLLDNYNYTDSNELLKQVESASAPVEEPLDSKTRGVEAAADSKAVDNKASKPTTREVEPPFTAPTSSSPAPDNTHMKKFISELTTELNSLRASTKAQMQNATERISQLEAENMNIKDASKNEIGSYEKRLAEKDLLIGELKGTIDPRALEITDEGDANSTSSSGKRRSVGGNVSELSKYKLDRLELSNKLLYYEQENGRLNDKFALFEPFMNNQVGELSKFQKIIKSQEEKIGRLSGQVKDEQVLHRQINEWKTKHDNLLLEFDNFRTLHAQDDFTDDEEEVSSGVTGGDEFVDPSNRSIMSTATGRRSKKDISTQLESLVNLWHTQSAKEGKKEVSSSGSANDPFVQKLQKQVDELLFVGKQNEAKSSSEIARLKDELAEKLQNLKVFEENYRDALQSVNNTSKALKMNDDEVRNQKQMIEKLIKENNELQLFMKASKRHSSRGATGAPLAPGIGSPNLPHAITEEDENIDDDSAINNAHFNMKIQDLEADLYILKQERDQLKENVTSLQKELYLTKANS